MIKKSLIFTGALFFLFILANYVIMPLYVKHSDTVKVPKVTGLNYIEAKKIVNQGGLEIIQGELKYDENIPIGMILDQNPPADETVKYGRRIYVTMCGGEQLADVPNLKGKSIRDAKFTLEQRGLKLGETVKKNTNEFPADFVISQVIQPGSKLKKNSTIDLILSDGPTIGDLKVPVIVGKNLEEAKKIITDNKLKVGKITYQTNNDLPPGQIIDQYPKADKSANENTSVDLFVARKKVVVIKESDEESSDTKTDAIKQDDVTGQTNKTETVKDKINDTKTTPTDKSLEKKIEKSPPVKKDDPKINKNDSRNDDNTNGQ